MNPSPISMGCIFFHRAQTIYCLKLAVAFDAQESEYGISHILNGAESYTQHSVVISFARWAGICLVAVCRRGVY